MNYSCLTIEELQRRALDQRDVEAAFELAARIDPDDSYDEGYEDGYAAGSMDAEIEAEGDGKEGEDKENPGAGPGLNRTGRIRKEVRK